MALHFLKSDKPIESNQKTTDSEPVTEPTTVPKAIAESGTSNKPSEPAKPVSRKRVLGQIVSISFRVPKDVWMTLQHLAMTEGRSLQSLLWDACSAYLVSKGQPPL
jgi:hypothetical protein